jgi:hypothetical protein
MFTLRLASAFFGLILMSACGASATPEPLAGSSSNPTSPASPASESSFGNAVLVGHGIDPATVRPLAEEVFVKLDGSVLANVPGVGVSDEHAVGAYLVVAGDGSGKGWTVDASGVVKDVAPAAVAILTPTIEGGWTPPLIVNATTAVIVRGANDGLTANEVDLSTGAVRPLLTVPYTGVMALQALTVLDVSSDRKTVWLSKITSTGGITGRLEIIGIDLQTGTVSSEGQANALAGAEIAITRDGKWVAGQEDAGTNGSNLLIRHLHVVALGTNVDSDVQGTAEYVGGQRSPSVLFAPGGAAVAWWGGLNNGSSEFLINVATMGSTGRTLRLDANRLAPTSAVFWVDPATLVVQVGLQTLTINTATASPTVVSQKFSYLDAVIN